jgi:hypothetical protein
VTRVKKPDDGRDVDKLTRRILHEGFNGPRWWPRGRKAVSTAKSIELGLQEEGDVCVSAVTLVQIEFLGEKGDIIFGVKNSRKTRSGRLAMRTWKGNNGSDAAT